MEPPRKILVPVDLSKRSEEALSYAAMMAERFGSKLVLTTNVNMPERAVLENFADSEHTTIEDAAKAVLRQLANKRASEVSSTIDVRFREFPAEGILDAAEESGIDMIVIASHGRAGMTRWLLGSVAEKIARGAQIPVVIVPTRT